MFVFGDPADAAKMHLDMFLEGSGPGLPDVHFDEMEEQDLRNAMAYLHVALMKALVHGLDDAVVDILTEWYDEVFYALAEVSERFRDNVRGGFVFPPGGPPVRQKYLALVEEASES